MFHLVVDIRRHEKISISNFEKNIFAGLSKRSDLKPRSLWVSAIEFPKVF